MLPTTQNRSWLPLAGVMLLALPTGLLAQSPLPATTAAPPAPRAAAVEASGASPTIGEPVEPNPAEPHRDGQELVWAAARQLARHRSVACYVRYRAEAFGAQLAGSGTYLQLADDQSSTGDPLVRLALKMQLGAQVSSLLQVNDGRFVWLRRDMPEGTMLGRIDLKRVRDAARSRPAAETASGTTDATLSLALGGWPQLLASLATRFDFAAPRAKQLRDLPVHALVGHWRREQLAELLPAQREAIMAGQPPRLDKLPEHVPAEVLLVLGRDDLFPYRVEFRRASTAGGGEGKGGRPLVALELFEVQLGAPLDRQQFAYQPDNHDVHDQTDAALRRLGLAPALEASKPTERR